MATLIRGKTSNYLHYFGWLSLSLSFFSYSINHVL